MGPLSRLHTAVTALPQSDHLQAGPLLVAAKTADLIAQAASPATVLRGSARQSTDDLRPFKDTIKDKLDSLSEMGEMESLRLQMAMDRMSKMMEALSNVLKKIDGTASGMVGNLK